MVGTSSDLTGREAELFRGQGRRKRVRSNLRRDVYVFEASGLLPLLGTGLSFNATSFAVDLVGSCGRMVRKLTNRSCKFCGRFRSPESTARFLALLPWAQLRGDAHPLHHMHHFKKSTSGLDQRESSQSRYDEMKRWTGRDGSFSRMQLWPSDKSDTQLEIFASLHVFFMFLFIPPPPHPSLPPSTTCKPALTHTLARHDTITIPNERTPDTSAIFPFYRSSAADSQPSTHDSGPVQIQDLFP